MEISTETLFKISPVMRLSFIATVLASAIAVCEASNKMVIGYFPNWLYANYPVENIPYSKYTHINYAFAILNNLDNLPSFTDDWAVEAYLPNIVRNAHQSNTKILLSVGGWTGSKRFSPMVASKESRQRFIDWNINFIEKYQTDGVDIDWEYPAKQAAGCNEFSEDDAENFLLLLQELRSSLDARFPNKHKEISMAVHVQPFLKSGTPMTDLKAYVPYFDHVNLMTYDINGAWAPNTGPNAPFKHVDGKGASFSFVESIRQWKEAGVPANKITAGLAFYGRTMKANVNMIEDPTNQYQPSQIGAPRGDSDDAYWDDPYCNAQPGGVSGVWKWSNLRKEGLLGNDFITAGNGWVRHWDNVSQTPWLFNPISQNFITYDDPQSIGIKVQHALCEDLAGVMVWDIHQDNGELLDAVSKIHDPISASTCQAIDSPSIFDESDEYGDLDEWSPSSKAAPSLTRQVPSTAIQAPSTVLGATPTRQAASTAIQAAPSQAILTTTTFVAQPTQYSSSLEGKTCPMAGQQKCVQSGQSGKWATCNFGQWIERDCSAGLVCVDNQGGLYCDFPTNKPRNRAARVKASKKSASLMPTVEPRSSLAPRISNVGESHLRSLFVERPVDRMAFF